jgi:hypothetical protein
MMRDANTVYVKYRNENNSNETNAALEDPDETYYEYNIKNIERLEKKQDEGYIKIRNISLKMRDPLQEVKNFKAKGQTFDTLTFGWLNSIFGGDETDGYLIKLNHRIDTYEDKDQIYDKDYLEQEALNTGLVKNKKEQRLQYLGFLR